MTLTEAQAYAQRVANRTGSSVLVYRATHKPYAAPIYGFDYTLPMWGERVGDRIYPNGFDDEDVKYSQETR